MRILFLGDVTGKSGRAAVIDRLGSLKAEYSPDFTIVNGENSAHGKGITGKIYRSLKAAGADVEIMEVADADVDKALSFDVLALGCPAMGDEELEEGEFEPFFSDLEGKLSGKKVALFGSYDWGDGEWMRTWCGRAKDAGAELVDDEGLIVNNTPDDEGLAACRELGGKLA